MNSSSNISTLIVYIVCLIHLSAQSIDHRRRIKNATKLCSRAHSNSFSFMFFLLYDAVYSLILSCSGLCISSHLDNQPMSFSKETNNNHKPNRTFSYSTQFTIIPNAINSFHNNSNNDGTSNTTYLMVIKRNKNKKKLFIFFWTIFGCCYCYLY